MYPEITVPFTYVIKGPLILCWVIVKAKTTILPYISVALIIDYVDLLPNRNYIVEGLVKRIVVAYISFTIPKFVIVYNGTDTVLRVS